MHEAHITAGNRITVPRIIREAMNMKPGDIIAFIPSGRGFRLEVDKPTARNARGVDIIAYNKDASRYVSVQVKALSKRSAVPLGTSLDKIMGDFWVVINKIATTPSAYILRPSEVRDSAGRNEKEGRVSFWLEPPDYEAEAYREAWHRIGYGGRDGPLKP